MAKPKKRTLQVSVWSDDDEAVAAFVNAVCLAATATFGADNQDVIYAGIGTRKVQAAAALPTWRSANVKGRMKLR